MLIFFFQVNKRGKLVHVNRIETIVWKINTSNCSCSHLGLVHSVFAQLCSLEICPHLPNILKDEIPPLPSIGFVISFLGILDNGRQIPICKPSHPIPQSFETQWHKAGHVMVHNVFRHPRVVLKSDIHANHHLYIEENSF